jgi:hypothetical protein
MYSWEIIYFIVAVLQPTIPVTFPAEPTAAQGDAPAKTLTHQSLVTATHQLEVLPEEDSSSKL